MGILTGRMTSIIGAINYTKKFKDISGVSKKMIESKFDKIFRNRLKFEFKSFLKKTVDTL